MWSDFFRIILWATNTWPRLRARSLLCNSEYYLLLDQAWRLLRQKELKKKTIYLFYRVWLCKSQMANAILTLSSKGPINAISRESSGKLHTGLVSRMQEKLIQAGTGAEKDLLGCGIERGARLKRSWKSLAYVAWQDKTWYGCDCSINELRG